MPSKAARASSAAFLPTWRSALAPKATPWPTIRGPRGRRAPPATRRPAAPRRAQWLVRTTPRVTPGPTLGTAATLTAPSTAANWAAAPPPCPSPAAGLAGPARAQTSPARRAPPPPTAPRATTAKRMDFATTTACCAASASTPQRALARPPIPATCAGCSATPIIAALVARASPGAAPPPRHPAPPRLRSRQTTQLTTMQTPVRLGAGRRAARRAPCRSARWATPAPRWRAPPTRTATPDALNLVSPIAGLELCV
jgi:hypothetical protein